MPTVRIPSDLKGDTIEDTMGMVYDLLHPEEATSPPEPKPFRSTLMPRGGPHDLTADENAAMPDTDEARRLVAWIATGMKAPIFAPQVYTPDGRFVENRFGALGDWREAMDAVPQRFKDIGRIFGQAEIPAYEPPPLTPAQVLRNVFGWISGKIAPVGPPPPGRSVGGFRG